MKLAPVARTFCLGAAILSLAACNEGRTGDGGTDPDASVDGGGGDASSDGGIDIPDALEVGVDTPGEDTGRDTGTDTPIDDTGADADAGTDAGTDAGADADPDILIDTDIPPYCGDGVVDADEACDDGDANSDTAPDACRVDCALATCGDGVTDGGEACDDGDANSDTAPDACRLDCSAATCGDGVTDGGEACDDGADNSDIASDRCRTTCAAPTCGDGVVDSGEGCDDGNRFDGDTCGNDCVLNGAQLCQACVSDAQCGGADDACVQLNNGDFCAASCDGGCSDGFVCASVNSVSGDVVSQCVPLTLRCEGCLDRDGDGFGVGPECLGFDCDEDSVIVNSGTAEICDGLDNNCDGDIDNDPRDGTLYYADTDGDDFGDDDASRVACGPEGEYSATVGGDCRPGDRDSYPGADEVCDGLDNDCDGPVDNDAIDQRDWFLDADGDTYGAGAATFGCSPGDGWVDRDGDCEAELPAINPGADEVCDGVDNDCSGTADDDVVGALIRYPDTDGDGFGDASMPVGLCAEAPGYYPIGLDCNDDLTAVNPDASEICDDGIDNDCDDAPDCLDTDCAGTDGCALDCVDVTLGSPTGDAAITGTTTGAGNDETGSCPTNGTDVVHLWTAPSAGAWVFDTIGSAYDTALHARTPLCDGAAELACNDDLAPSGTNRLQSRIIVDLAAGERILLIVDGFSGTTAGEFVVNINPGVPEICGNGVDDDLDDAIDCFDTDCTAEPACLATCPADSIGSVIGTDVASGDTTGLSNDFAGSCGGTIGPDTTVAWTAPADGTYTATTAGSAYDNRMYARLGCGGVELDCDFATGDGTTSISFFAETGDDVVFFIDGVDESAGLWQLNIAQTESGACTDGIDNDGNGDTDCADRNCLGDAACTSFAGCPEVDMGSAFGEAVVTGTTVGAGTDLFGTCGATGGQPGGAFAPELTHIWTAPADGTFTFTTAGSAYDTLIYAYDTCGGDVVACNDDVGGGVTTSTLTFGMAAGEPVILVVDGWNANAGAYQINVTGVEAGYCDDAADNDGDGAIDCDDTECAALEACCAGDIFDPNDGFTVPSTTFDAYLTAGGATVPLQIQPDDFDSFRVPSCDGGTLAVMAMAEAGGNVDLRVLANAGGGVALLYEGTEAGELESASVDVGAFAEVFVQIYAATCTDYTLDMQVIGCAP